MDSDKRRQNKYTHKMINGCSLQKCNIQIIFDFFGYIFSVCVNHRLGGRLVGSKWLFWSGKGIIRQVKEFGKNFML